MKNFNTSYKRKKKINQTLLPSLFMTLLFMGISPQVWGQWNNPPGITATANLCNRTFTVIYPVWFVNRDGNDTEIEQLTLTVDDGDGPKTVWIGSFLNNSNGIELNTNGWDGDESIGEQYYGGWSAVSGNWFLSANNPNSSQDTWVTYTHPLKTVPASWYGKTITVRVFGSFDGPQYDESKTITFPAIPEPSGLQATKANNNLCDKIELTWAKPDLFCDDGFSYTIQRRPPGGSWSTLTTINDQDTESYTHSGLNPGEKYEYHIRTNFGSAHSSFSSMVTGSTTALPEAPISFEASDGNCDQTVDLSWDFSLEGGVATPENFRIERNGLTITSSIDGNSRSFKDEEVPTRGDNYTYKIWARNVCGWSSNTAQDQGGSPADPTPPADVSTATEPGVGIRITWPLADQVTVTEYKIERNLLGGGGSTFLGPIDANETTYLDESVVACQTYEYRVIAINDCKEDGVPTEVASSARLVPDLSNTFDDKALIATKGFHSDRVELIWTIDNNLNFINAFKIYRRELGSPDEALIASLNSGSNIYVDNLTEAGKLYEYSIIAETQCENETVYSNVSKTIGFRSPFGTVTGSVSYSGGTPVKDVKVIGETTAQIFGKSIEFDGNDYLDITHKDNLNTQGELLLETWLRPTAYNQNFSLMEKPGSYALKYSQSEQEYQFTLEYNGSQSSTIRLDATELSLDNYHHLAAQLHEDSLKFYLNGEVKVSEYLGDNIDIDDNSDDIKIGDGYEGLLTELRIWTMGKSDDQLKRDYSRLLVGGEQGLAAYLRTNEGRGDYAYDASKSDGVFNRNHAAFVGDPTWSDIIPSNSQLGLIAYTNENGIYILIMPYNGNGETFVLTPTFPSHQFNPATKALYLGDGSAVHNNIDFEDKSSFVVSGTVFFDQKLHGDGSNCASEGVKINVINKDEVVVVAGLEVTSSAGEFTVEVPIGDHYIQLEKADHVFSVGRFPAENTFNFQEPLAGLEFVDSTYRRVIGRVVGGLKEGNKKLGFGLLPEHRNNYDHSINNIGTANITFKTQSGCKTLMVETDDETGEYEAWLPPLRYTIENIELENNFGNALFDQDNIANGIGSALNLTDVGEAKIVRDTFLGAADDPIVDSISYNAIYKVIHRNNPTIEVKGDMPTTMAGDSLFVGETELDLGDGTILPLIPIDPGNSPIPYPVFKQNNAYKARIFINEVYHRYDADGSIIFTDNTPSIGKLTIINSLDAQTYVNNDIIIRNGKFDYAFRAGEPNKSLGAITQYNYTDPMEIVFESDGVETVNYQPFPMEDGGDQFYRGYILGGTLTGTDITVAGPASVDLILRDPPGSNSYATWAADSTYTTIKQARETSNHDINESVFGQVGTEFDLGLGLSPGPAINFSAHVRTTANFSQGIYQTEDNIEVNEFKTSESISTSALSLPEFVGAQGDVMVGTSTFQSFGKGLFLTPVKENLCANPDVICFGNEISTGYMLGFKPGIVFLPDSGLTKYIFTVYEIENVVIPDLETIRNELFVSKPDYYVSHVADETAPDFKRKFGSNNDDFNVWGDAVSTQEYFEAQEKDTTGMSYTFYRSKHLADFDSGVDSIRVVNNQIRLWKLALAKNEKAKYEAYTMPADSFIIENITIGTAVLEKSYSVTNEKTESTTKETQFLYGGDVELQALINGTGAGGNIGYSYTDISGSTSDTTNVVTNTFQYHIEDGDLGDLINVSVINPKDGNSPIFRVNGGQTSCPFMDAEIMHYYDKNNPGNPDDLVFASTYISNPDNTYSPRTVQRDKPTIDVTQSNLFNIPADEPAVFTLLLGNESESDDDRYYDLSIDLGSNPSGAILEIDGLDPNREYLVPYSLGASTPLTKTLTLRRGPNHFDYENIKIILKSPCDKRIYDSIFISAHFIPTCTKAEVYSPGDNWVLNNSYDNKLPINIQEYNYNYAGFEEMKFQYKLASGSTWFDAARFLKDTMGLSNEPDVYYISNQTTFSTFDWDVSMLDDGFYEFRALSICNFPAYTNIRNESDPSSGIMDRINPHPFGNPSPADGILSPNDEISIKFNEPIDLGSLTAQNFDIRGVLNGTPTNHGTSLFFDGVDDYVEVTGGAALRNRDFTIAFAAKRAGTGEQAIISQGTDIKERIFIGFNANDQFVFRIGEEEVASTMSFTDDEWRYYGVSYNHTTETAELYVINEIVNVGNTSIFQDYTGSGKLLFGKNTVNNADHFEGKLHEVSIWGTARSLAEFSVSSGRLLSAGELGILYNWRMDEANGSLAVEHIRRRDGNIAGPTWSIEPNGHAASFDGADDYLKVAAGDVVVTPGMDFTLEFWFNSSQAGEATLFSNGTASNMESDSLFSWNIDKDAAGKIHVKNYGIEFVAVDSNFFDGSWHHFALVLQRTGSLSAYIDGNLQNSTQALPFKQFGGSHIYLGARGFMMGVAETVENHFAGQIDEFRFWNASRKVEQIRRDKQNRMKGDELGLLMYFPFENYQEDPSGPPILTETFDEQIDPANHTVENPNGTTLIDQTPTIKLQRPVQGIAFTYSVNNDEIIFTPTTSQELIENVTLDVTVKDVKDLQGNVMESPKTWIAYVDKNQVFWQDDLLEFQKEVGEELSFSSAVINEGGSGKTFEIKNVPDWLSVTPQMGTIAANSQKQIQFEVDPLMNIGDYIQDLQLLTDFNFPERLTIGLKVREKEPEWAVNPGDFQNSMSIIGAIQIKGVISTDGEDKLAAFVGEEVRGINYLRYVPQIDRYLVFMDVYSNENFGEELTFKVWDASEGIIYSEVEPDFILFDANTLVGSTSAPQIFSTSFEISVDIEIKQGWNWISNFLFNKDSTNLDLVLESLDAQTGDEIKGLTDFSNYSQGNGWRGTLNNVGIRPESLYKLHVAKDGILKWKGDVLDPTSREITLVNNWNWIGFISIRNQSVAQALGQLTPTEGDLIKGRSQFAVYDDQLGWIGSLETMVPGSGYMYKSIGEKSFRYPLAGMFRNDPETPEDLMLEQWPIDYGAYASNMTAIAQFSKACDFPMDSEDFAIGVFDLPGNCRGVSLLHSRNEDQLHFLTITGTGTENLNMQLLNVTTAKAYPMEQEVAYASNSHLGEVSAPLLLSLSEEVCKNVQMEVDPPTELFTVYPSIFKQNLTLEYTAEMEDENARIILYNVWGQLVYQADLALEEGYNRHSISLNGQALEAGTYLVVLETNATQERQQVIKQ